MFTKFAKYIPGIGLVGLAVYQASVGNLETAGTTILMALGLLGLRSPTPTSVPKS